MAPSRTPLSSVAPSGWRSAGGRAAYLDAYAQAMELWPVPFEPLQVPTRFGDTHVVVCGPASALPVVLLHAATGFGSTQWYPNVASLCERHRVYAVDYIGSAGRGTQTEPMLTAGHCAEWLMDVLDHLGLVRVHLVGSSQGGWLGLNVAIRAPTRVGALVLLAPAGAIGPIRPIMRFMIRLGPFMPGWAGSPSIKGLLGGRAEIDERVVRLLTLHLKHFRYQRRAVFPTAFSDRQLEGVSAPVLLQIGDKERIYDPVSILQRARMLLPDVEAELVSNTGHLINMERPEATNARLTAFLGRHP